MSSEITDDMLPPVRDLDAERISLERMIARHSKASKEYTRGKLRVLDREGSK
jgi:hypothetical protein